MIGDDILSVVLYAFNWCRSTFWTFHLFGREWSFTFLSIFTMPLIAGLTIRIIKLVFDLANE